MDGIFPIIMAILFGVGGYQLAKKKGRRPMLWAALGFFFTIIALIWLAVLKKVEPEESPVHPVQNPNVQPKVQPPQQPYVQPQAPPPQQAYAQPQSPPPQGAFPRPAASQANVVSPEAYQRPYTISAQGLDPSFRANGDYDTVEFGMLTGTQFADQVTGIAPLEDDADDDLCPVHVNFHRDGQEVWIMLQSPDGWSCDDPIVGVADEFTTPELAIWLEQAVAALAQSGLRA